MGIIAGIGGVSGSSATLLNGPHDMFFFNDSMYVADYYNGRVQKFSGGSPTATTLTNLTVTYAAGIHVTNTGVVYVIDSSNCKIVQWFNSVSTVVAGNRVCAGGLNQISVGYGVTVDASSNVYASECNNHRVTLWTAGNPNISQVVCIRFYS